MKRKILIIALWSFGTLVVIALFGFIDSRRRAVMCTATEVRITGDPEIHFLSEEDVLQLLADRGIRCSDVRVKDIDPAVAEQVLDAHPAVEDANVYCTLNGKLVVEIIQRSPLFRVIDFSGESYYIDNKGKYMPLISGFTARVPVATGHITDSRYWYSASMQEVMKNDSLARKAIVDDLFVIVEAMAKDSFLFAQLEQLNVRADREIELIPRVGPGLVLLGDVEHLEDKLKRLKLFYTRGAKMARWNTYSAINLKYRDQIICTKSTQ